MKKIKLDLGCGEKVRDGFLGVDQHPFKCVSYVVDFNKKKLPLKDSTVDEIVSNHFIEHVEDPFKVIGECNRVLKKGSKLTFAVPYFAHPYSHVPNHKTYWSFISKIYFDGSYHEPYGQWKKVSIKHGWGGSSFFWKPIQFIFDLIIKVNPLFYEKRLCYLFPVFELIFELEK